ncbi:prenyltransferase [Halopseudomonas sp.]|uniref:prenyltransferase n=1 Tax=Halopseudomonas sp. TaxID=2901191 RepID=UPI003565E7E2
MTLKAVLKSMRLPFLMLTPACVLLGVATAVVGSEAVIWSNLWLALLGALAAHIAVNTLNEYQDFRSGLDAITSRTAFSGGSGALVNWPDAALAVRRAAGLSLAVVVLIGIYFVAQYGAAILPIGLLGVAIILLYTGWVNRRPWLCLVTPGIAFGPLMVMGTHFVLTGQYSLLAAGVSLVPFFLANNLLLLNQYPDVDADRQVGRRHLPIVYGLGFAARVYGAMVVASVLVVLVGVFSGALPTLCLLTLLTAAAGGAAWMGARRHGDQMEKLKPYLGWNVVAAVGTPVMLAITLMLGS